MSTTIGPAAEAVLRTWRLTGMQRLRVAYPELTVAVADLDTTVRGDSHDALVVAATDVVDAWDDTGMEQARDVFPELAVAVDRLDDAIEALLVAPELRPESREAGEMTSFHARAGAIVELWDRTGMQGLRHPFPELAGAMDDLEAALEADDGIGIVESALAFVRIWEATGMHALRAEFREMAVAVDLLELALQTARTAPLRGGRGLS